ncbi:carboxypeptidase-like regulatory domain-containing protein [Paramaledivibacter caminithermalis]|jgi:protocatechuate 3,4-dioxygenase beta subunit|uniref:Carboxypeptidase regulatory-like domain-containing protein n=1 Tax=Paramaledivibacter caminithermalis (strain DSM 15212 / CIP 107654 / DViRD3) TaxID=1121301 RepID=A0A1M6JWX2_PARC5|nr:carboxypeptidase-like regulatory domain-containing protein [Paramaledivibacter caminithermalis]SHJ51161.1 Carboxypeptidase regulatory-like domain-containing protein [Paramaledivibacter caminithermalis DSM 15212]
MSDLYKLGQSKQGDLKKVGEEIRLDVKLSKDPFLNTGSIMGTITDPDGNAVSGALIKILDNDNNPLYHTLTDDTGFYNISDITPASELRFSAVKTGYLLNETTSFSIVAGQTITMDEVIHPDPNAELSTITAHIYDELGNPLEGVTASISKIVEGSEVPYAITTTNEYGQCVFTKVELGTYIGRGTKQGYQTTEIEIQVTQPGSMINLTGTMEISPTTSQGTINGIIKDEEGNPVVGAVVILYEVTGDTENPTLTPIRYTRTISGGAYLFGEVPQGKYIVKANKEQ